MEIECIGVRSKSMENVLRALEACFRPFESLTQRVDVMALARAMREYVDFRAGHGTEVAAEILRHVQGAKTDKIATVEFGLFEVALRTPTSGTVIRLRSHIGGGYSLEVRFCPGGSVIRAQQILENLLISGLNPKAYPLEGEWMHRDDILVVLLRKAKEHLDRCKSTGRDTRNAAERLHALEALTDGDD